MKKIKKTLTFSPSEQAQIADILDKEKKEVFQSLLAKLSQNKDIFTLETFEDVAMALILVGLDEFNRFQLDDFYRTSSSIMTELVSPEMLESIQKTSLKALNNFLEGAKVK